MFAFPTLPTDVMPARLHSIAERYPLSGRIAQPKADGKADFWNAVGGQYKASLDYVTTIACESGTAVERGPEVRTQTITARLGRRPGARDRRDAPLRRHGRRQGRRSRSPARGSRCPELGLLATAGPDGRFRFDRVPSGSHKLVVRAPDGGEAKADIDVPGSKADLVIRKAK